MPIRLTPCIVWCVLYIMSIYIHTWYTIRNVTVGVYFDTWFVDVCLRCNIVNDNDSYKWSRSPVTTSSLIVQVTRPISTCVFNHIEMCLYWHLNTTHMYIVYSTYNVSYTVLHTLCKLSPILTTHPATGLCDVYEEPWWLAGYDNYILNCFIVAQWFSLHILTPHDDDNSCTVYKLHRPTSAILYRMTYVCVGGWRLWPSWRHSWPVPSVL